MVSSYSTGRRIKAFCILITAVFLLFCVAGCAGSDGMTSGKTVKIGLLVSYTGVFTNLGYSINNGMELYFDQIGWKAGGVQIKLIKEDDEGSAQTGLQKTRKLIDSDKVDILTGVISSTVAYAIRDYVIAKKVPFIISNAGASDLTRSKANPFTFRVSFSNSQYEYPLGTYAYDKMNLKTAVVMAPDYAAGHEKAQGFMDGFKEAGGKIIQEIYPKLGTNDYGPFLTQVDKNADVVFAFFSGSDSVAFVKQYSEYGLKKIPLLCAGDMVDESALPSQGDTALGIISALHYSASLDTKENREFVKNYEEKYKASPNMFAEQGYVAAAVIAGALEETGGDTSDKDKLLDAIRKVEFSAPRGPFKFDQATQNVIFNVYLRKVEKVDGQLINSVFETIPEVSDKWTPTK